MTGRCIIQHVERIEIPQEQHYEMFEIACELGDICRDVEYWGKAFDREELERLEHRLWEVYGQCKLIYRTEGE